tara:strand:- start:2252 stop:3355 length:1104 start_codon:yes stop_codon:yes gene_type:complete
MSEINNKEIEFSFFYLFEEIRKKIITVLIITLISFLFGLFFYYNQEKTYTFENKFSLIEKKSFYSFLEINNFLLGTKIQGEDMSDIIISRKSLNDMFIEKFKINREFLAVLNAKYKGNLNEKKEINNFLINQSKNYLIYEDKIVFTSSIEDQIFHYEVLDESIKEINLNIKKDLIDLIKNKLAIKESILINKIADTERNIETKKNKYSKDKKTKITKLQEQINIAKKIDLKDGIKDGIYANVFHKVPEYYRGYAALEAELENLNQRDDSDISLYDENYSKEQVILDSLYLQLNKIKSEDIVIEKIKQIDPFNSITIDLSNYQKTENFLNIFKVIVASILIGFISSIIIVLLYAGYVQYNLTQKDSLN